MAILKGPAASTWGAVFLSLLFSGTPAWSAYSAKWALCTTQDPALLDQRISACSDLIETVKKRDLQSKAYGNRGVARLSRSLSGPNLASSDEEKHSAIADFERAIALDQTSAWGHKFRANLHSARGDHDAAIKELDTAIRLAPKEALFYTAHAGQYALKKQYDLAIADYARAIQRDSRAILAFSGRGYVYMQTRNYLGAIADFSQAIRLSPKYPSFWRARAHAHHRLGDLKALADYGEVIALNPEDKNGWLERATFHYDKRRYSDAIADYTEAIRLAPEFSSVWLGRAHMYFGSRDCEKAIHDYGKAIHLGDPTGHAWTYRATCLMRLRDYERALGDANEAIRHNATDSDAYQLRGQLFMLTKQIDLALADFDDAIRVGPTNYQAYAGRCGARVAVGTDLQGALSDCNRALQLMPQRLEALSIRGFIYLKLDELDQAIVDFSAVLTKQYNHSWTLYGRGLAKRKKGDDSSAEIDISTARTIQGDVEKLVNDYYNLK